MGGFAFGGLVFGIFLAVGGVAIAVDYAYGGLALSLNDLIYDFLFLAEAHSSPWLSWFILVSLEYQLAIITPAGEDQAASDPDVENR